MSQFLDVDLIARAEAAIRSNAEAANTAEARRPYGDPAFAPVDEAQWPNLVDNYLGGPIGQHCKRWTPAVALAIADWLATGANPYSCVRREPMIAVARAYLAELDGEDS